MRTLFYRTKANGGTRLTAEQMAAAKIHVAHQSRWPGMRALWGEEFSGRNWRSPGNEWFTAKRLLHINQPEVKAAERGLKTCKCHPGFTVQSSWTTQRERLASTDKGQLTYPLHHSAVIELLLLATSKDIQFTVTHEVGRRHVLPNALTTGISNLNELFLSQQTRNSFQLLVDPTCLQRNRMCNCPHFAWEHSMWKQMWQFLFPWFGMT